jgi:hypothetical protein
MIQEGIPPRNQREGIPTSIEYEHHGLKAKEKHEKGTGTETRGPTEKIPIQVLRAREEGS